MRPICTIILIKYSKTLFSSIMERKREGRKTRQFKLTAIEAIICSYLTGLAECELLKVQTDCWHLCILLETVMGYQEKKEI